jgi:hypothetical protein
MTMIYVCVHKRNSAGLHVFHLYNTHQTGCVTKSPSAELKGMAFGYTVMHKRLRLCPHAIASLVVVRHVSGVSYFNAALGTHIAVGLAVRLVMWLECMARTRPHPAWFHRHDMAVFELICPTVCALDQAVHTCTAGDGGRAGRHTIRSRVRCGFLAP